MLEYNLWEEYRNEVRIARCTVKDRKLKKTYYFAAYPETPETILLLEKSTGMSRVPYQLLECSFIRGIWEISDPEYKSVLDAHLIAALNLANTKLKAISATMNANDKNLKAKLV